MANKMQCKFRRINRLKTSYREKRFSRNLQIEATLCLALLTGSRKIEH